MSPPRRVRRAPVSERIKAYLNPWDFLLWLSEEINSNELQETCTQWATPGGIAINLVFIIARANAGYASAQRGDDVFGDYHERFGSGWLAWLAAFLVHLLSFFSILNAFYTFTRRRHYRLFEANVEINPNAPSARRVRVDSSPMASSPMKFFSSILNATRAESRAYPDAARDVWEVAVWDPTPLCLRLFCLFSPGHVLVYWLFLPLRALDPKPSVTVATTMALTTLFSMLLITLQSFFAQQAKDTALIHREVQHEYDTKFVHPQMNKPVRDVGTQMIPPKWSGAIPEVQTYTPTTYVNRGFQVSPNPNYSPLFDPDGVARHREHLQRSVTTPTLHHARAAVGTGSGFSSPMRPTPTPATRQPSLRPSTATSTGDGGSFGIYSHAQSPLRKQVSSNALRERSPAKTKREASPLKQSSLLGQPNFSSSSSHLRGDGLKRDRESRPY